MRPGLDLESHEYPFTAEFQQEVFSETELPVLGTIGDSGGREKHAGGGEHYQYKDDYKT
jgi:hypothetical protein